MTGQLNMLFFSAFKLLLQGDPERGSGGWEQFTSRFSCWDTAAVADGTTCSFSQFTPQIFVSAVSMPRLNATTPNNLTYQVLSHLRCFSQKERAATAASCALAAISTFACSRGCGHFGAAAAQTYADYLNRPLATLRFALRELRTAVQCTVKVALSPMRSGWAGALLRSACLTRRHNSCVVSAHAAWLLSPWQAQTWAASNMTYAHERSVNSVPRMQL